MITKIFHGGQVVLLLRTISSPNLLWHKFGDALINRLSSDQKYIDRSRPITIADRSTSKSIDQSHGLLTIGRLTIQIDDLTFNQIDNDQISIDHGDLSISDHQNRRRLDDCLACLKTKRPVENQASLIHVPNLSYRYNRSADFVDVVEEWFQRIRPFLDKRSRDQGKPIKIASWIIHLGKLNQQTNGAVREKLKSKFDGRSIDLLIRGLIDDGLDNLSFKDLNGALTGIRDLLLFPVDSTPDHRSVLEDLIRSINRYLTIKDWHRSPRQQDDDYLFAIIHGARSTLTLLKQMEIRPQDRRNGDLIRILCRLVKDGFVYVANHGYREMVESMEFDLQEISTFAYVWLYWNRNPEEFADGIWESWYRAFERILDDRKCNNRSITDRSSPDEIIYFEHALAIAHFFNQRPHFWPIFPKWYDSLKSIIDSSRSIKAQETCDLLYTIALVWSRDHPLPQDCHQRLPELLIDLEKSIIRSDLDQITFKSIGRALWSFGNLRRTFASSRSRFPPSPSFLTYLTDWTDFIGQQKIDRSKISDEAATVMYFLCFLDPRLNQDSALLGNLAHLFVEGIDHILIDDLTRSLSYFGLSCSKFLFDPPIPSIWTRWFRKAEQTLIILTSSKSIRSGISDQKSVKWGTDSHVTKLLMTMLIVGRQFEMDELEKIMPVWRGKILEMAEKGKVKKLEDLIDRLKDIQRLRPSCVSGQFLKDLGMIS